MRILQFTLPAPENKTIITKEEVIPHFYPHLHRHNEVQLTWIIEGEGTLVTDNTMHSFHSNEIYWIGANQSHVFKNNSEYFEATSKKRVHHLDIYFDLEAQLASFFSIPEVIHLKNFIANHNTGFAVPKQHVKEIAESMMMVQNTTGLEQFFQFISLLKKIVFFDDVKLLSTCSNKTICSESEGIRMATIYSHIMQNYQQNISLEEVSKLVHMTPQAFCRYFKKHTQHTLMSFINHVRINEVCKMLLNKNYDSISSIAYMTGFNSITNFNRVFRRVTHKSPKEYIESYLYTTRKRAFSIA